MADVGPLAQGGLNEAFGLAVGARGVRAGEVVADAEFGASMVEQVGAVAVSVVGEQAANEDAVLGIESHGGAQEGNGSVGFLVGQHAGKGQGGVVVNGDVQGLPAGELGTAAAASIAAQGDALIAGQGFDVEVEQIAGSGMLIAEDGGSQCSIPRSHPSG